MLYEVITLSMRINYPNTSDKILSNKTKPGGNICIHGNCVTIGCMPITDDLIKELYIFCIEAKNNGQGDIPRITSYNVCYTKLLRYELI